MIELHNARTPYIYIIGIQQPTLFLNFLFRISSSHIINSVCWRHALINGPSSNISQRIAVAQRRDVLHKVVN